MGAYLTYLTTPVGDGGLAPPFLLQPAGIAMLGGIGSVLDAVTVKAKLARCAHMPLRAPADALVALGLERQIVRGLSETDSAYALRVQAAWVSWAFAGAPFGLLDALKAMGYSNVTIEPVRGGSCALSAGSLVRSAQSSGVWMIDSDAVPALIGWSALTAYALDKKLFPVPRNGFFYVASKAGTTGVASPAWPTTIGQQVTDGGIIWGCAGHDNWSRFDVIFSPVPASWSPIPPAYTSDEMTRIRQVISLWRPAWSACNRIIADVSGALWGWNDGTWGDGGTWGSSSATYYSPA